VGGKGRVRELRQQKKAHEQQETQHGSGIKKEGLILVVRCQTKGGRVAEDQRGKSRAKPPKRQSGGRGFILYNLQGYEGLLKRGQDTVGWGKTTSILLTRWGGDNAHIGGDQVAKANKGTKVEKERCFTFKTYC